MDERPLCDICDHEAVGGHCYNINGEVICMHCMEEYFRQDLPGGDDEEDE